MVKKKKQSVEGNTFDQDFDNLKFVQDYSKWKENCLSISGTDIGVVNIPTLWDFLITHILEDESNVRDASVNKGKGGQGAIAALEAIEDIIEERVLTQVDIAVIRSAAGVLKNLKESTLDPKLIVFTEKIKDKSGKVTGKRALQGHYRTPEYVKGKKGLPAVPSDWYTGTGNPPHWAIFGGKSQFAKPAGLLEIMEGISDALGKKGAGVSIRDLQIENIRGANQVDNMSGIRGIEKYFDSMIKKPEFWKGGRLLVDKVQKDFSAQEFKATPREQSKVRTLAGLGTGKNAVDGTVRNFKVTDTTALPIIDLVNAALVRAGTNKAGDGFRAWQNSRRGGFDYRKTRKEVFGEDTKSPNAKVIAKSWRAILQGD